MNNANPVQFVPTGFTPTAEQRDIQGSRHRVTLVEANAGAAKTTTLALRIGEALARGLAPEQILALVFTPEAKDVMKSRLLDVGIASATAARVPVRTLEEFAGQVLATVEDGKPPQAKSAKDLKPYVLEAIAQVSQNYPDKAELLDIRTHDIAISQFLECQLQLKATMALNGDDEYSELEDTADRLGIPLTNYLSTLEYEKIRTGSFERVHFRDSFDAVYDLAVMLRDYPETKQALPRYTVVVGDELHDLNEASFRVLAAVIDMDDLYFVGAGDRDQVIHSHMGADEKYLNHDFTVSFPHAARYPLTMTYRHGPHLAYAMEAFKHKPVDSNLPVSTQIAEVLYDDGDPAACAERVVEAIKKWKSEKFPLEACAILLRDRHQSISIENALIHAGIGYRTQGMPSYLQREEILFLRGMVAIALRNLDTVKSESILKAIVESLAIFSEVEFDPKDMEEAKNTIAKDPGFLGMFFTGQIQRVGAKDASARISAAVAYMQDLAPETPAHIALSGICERIDVAAVAKRIYVHPYDASVIARSIDGFIAMAKKSAMSLRQFSESMGAADAFVSSRKSRNLVLVECVAYAKGKEFEHVILPFLEDGEFPSRMKGLGEEENLFYVGATRARSRLTLVTPVDKAKRSRFIERMELSSTRARANASLQRNQAARPPVPARYDLTVPYADKDIVKALGAQWDRTRKVWYVREGLNPGPFQHWLPKQ